MVILLLAFAMTAGATSAQIILPPGWPFLPPIIASPVIEVPPPAYYPKPYSYYSYPYSYRYHSHPHGYTGPRTWPPDHRGRGGRGYYGARGRSYRAHGGYRR